MPPRPRPIPKKPSLSKVPPPVVKHEQDAKAMPPPPDPPAPGILVPEVAALTTCLKNAVVKTGELYGFYADTRKLGIQNYAPSPPASLTAALGREVEKYDQLCDSIESQLLRAISVLQRDLAREERRIKEAEMEAEAKANSMAGRTRSASRSPTSTRTPLPTIDLAAVSGDGSRPSTADPTQSPPLSSNSTILGRRPSTISISSLHRPAFPLKLDLSANSLRISAEEASLFSHGLSSPVTLAPRSARPYGPNELPPDLMAALASASSTSDTTRPVEIDLTGPDAPDVKMAAVGNSADQPIELDLDAMEIDMAMSDLFGDAETGSNGGSAVEGLFTPVVAGPDMHNLGDTKNAQDESFLGALDGRNDDIFASLSADAHNNTQSDAPGSAPSASMSAPSPNSLLASFSQMEDASESNHNISGDGAPVYDLDSLDLSHLDPGFFGDGNGTDMGFDMEELLSIGGGDQTEDTEPNRQPDIQGKPDP
ncbi:hypothetical protein B0H15DRAFT_814700 [Mycena belliarum]|uniref:Uncharacterized protein n=1 Tax=Mycena belliarum TaxID=1033014 RepID=A0AAD6UNA2_9AGAR|nr:hypothetical protein B0H15DRAFT_814700 [Mycena belliae]